MLAHQDGFLFPLRDGCIYQYHSTTMGAAEQAKGLAVIFVPIFKEDDTMKLPNGFGSVYKMPGNRRKPWAVRITIGRKETKDGKTTWKYKYLGYYETKEEALSSLVHFNEHPYDMDANRITFAEIYEKWSAEHFPKVSESNVKGYRASYKICEPIKDMRFNDIRKSHLQNVVDISGKNYPTLRKLKILMNLIYKFAMENDICGKDYSQYVDITQYKDRNPDKIDRVPFSDIEIQILWNWVDKNEYVSVFLMMIYSGVRIGELRDLKKEDVHLEEKYFYIRESKTPAGIRNVPIADKVLKYFQYWMKRPSKCDYLITTREGRHMVDRNFRDSYWKPLLEEMGLNTEHRPHDTRHTCVSLLTKEGVDERIIKKIVGHAGKGVTQQVYTHMDMEQLLEAINKI